MQSSGEIDRYYCMLINKVMMRETFIIKMYVYTLE